MVAASECVGRDRLAEHHGVGLDDASAAVAAGRHDLGDFVERGAGVAGGAAEQGGAAVDFGHRLHAGGAVEAVDVLGDRVLEHADPLEFGHGEVGVVGLGVGDAAGELIGVAAAFGDALPPSGGIVAELVVLVERGLAVLGPEAVLAAEGGDAGFGGDARAGEGDAVAGGVEQFGRAAHFRLVGQRRVGGRVHGWSGLLGHGAILRRYEDAPANGGASSVSGALAAPDQSTWRTPKTRWMFSLRMSGSFLELCREHHSTIRQVRVGSAPDPRGDTAGGGVISGCA